MNKAIPSFLRCELLSSHTSSDRKGHVQFLHSSMQKQYYSLHPSLPQQDEQLSVFVFNGEQLASDLASCSNSCQHLRS